MWAVSRLARSQDEGQRTTSAPLVRLKLDDLLLVSDGQLLPSQSGGLGRRIVPVLFSRLSPHLLPPIAHFLRLLGQHGCRPWQAWS
ncbi:hypothetical protein E1294_45440 [Nonomuraea diastatica]|uniref:Lantibiotic dehydratase N-terminal domain-containing protein n=1 Tax=Nonomuraea diastatica TaxID=1848329 RepID=A0A4R4VYH9_9ACTN|nr:hypothetical protein E1294_45440 [Nonomuraea diastatica]